MTVTDLNVAEEKAFEIINELEKNFDTICSEEDSKVRSINRIFHEVLGWPFADFRCENSHDSGYSDYILIENESPALVVEAKRVGIIEIKIADKSKARNLKISGASMKEALPGIKQAASYATDTGINVAVLTDGVAWVIFKTFVSGAPYLEKEAVVFASLDAVKNDFSLFYELLSKECYGKRLYSHIFDQVHNRRLLLDQELLAPIPENDIHLMGKSALAFDLDKVFARFFSKLSGEKDKQLLFECFVETRESRIADFSLEKMTASVLGNIVSADRHMDDELARLVTENVESEEISTEAGQTVFIVGPTGAGKTTFLERFFHHTLPLSIRSRCVLLNINCLDAFGKEDTVLDWMTEKLIEITQAELYEDGRPSWDELRGLYYGEYLERQKGVDAILYNDNKKEFQKKFSELMDQKVNSDRDGYLKKILKNIVNSRKKLPVILIDNIDEFSLDYKQKIFQFVQALRRHINQCLVIFPITDKSAWSFSKTDIYGIYGSKSFFLPTPSPREVFRKRIDFIKEKLSDPTNKDRVKGEYFLAKGIRLSIENLKGFAQVVENIFVDNDYTAKTIGELSNYNIRRTLALSQRIITSPVIGADDLIKTYVSGELSNIPFTQFMDALLKGDYATYKAGDNSEVIQIFQVDNEIRQSPLLSLRILALLDSLGHGDKSIEERHLAVESIISYFDVLSFSETSIEKSLNLLLTSGLLEPYDVSSRDISVDQKLAISFKGHAHLRMSSRDSVYFFQMALTTSITDHDCAQKIHSIYESKRPFDEKIRTIRKIFLDYLIKEDLAFFAGKYPDVGYENQKELFLQLSKFSKDSSEELETLSNILGDNYKQGVIKSNQTCIVDHFDSVKNFGFVTCKGFEEGVYIHVDKLKQSGIKNVKVGDTLICDIARGEKGFFVNKIIKIVREVESIRIVNCVISRYNSRKGYGFVVVAGEDISAYFHFSIFNSEHRSRICEGVKLRAEIGPNRHEKGFFVREIIEVID